VVTNASMKEHQAQNDSQATKEITLRLRLYVVRRNGHYYGNCIDLNLSVERPTLEEALRELRLMINMYLEDISKIGLPKHLLYRKSRLAKRLEYHKLRVLYAVTRLLSHPLDCEVEVERKQLACAA